jgi:hypothetical protein
MSGGYAYMGAMPPMYELRVDVKVPLRRDRRQNGGSVRVLPDVLR